MQINPPSTNSTHAQQRSQQLCITGDDLEIAAADAVLTCQAGNRLQVQGRNGITYITDLTGREVITVLPRSARPPRTARRDAGVSRHRTDRRRPTGRTSDRRRRP